MSKKNNAPAKKAPVKLNLGAIIPAALLLIGLVIMTVCFFNVNGQLTDTRAALADAQARVAALEGTDVAETETAPVTTDEPAENAELVAANETIAALEAEVTALEAELAAANEVIAEKEALLVVANDAINQATAALEAIYGVPAEEEPAE